MRVKLRIKFIKIISFEAKGSNYVCKWLVVKSFCLSTNQIWTYKMTELVFLSITHLQITQAESNLANTTIKGGMGGGKKSSKARGHYVYLLQFHNAPLEERQEESRTRYSKVLYMNRNICVETRAIEWITQITWITWITHITTQSIIL